MKIGGAINIGTMVGMTYLGCPRYAIVQAIGARRLWLTTDGIPKHLPPLKLAWVRPRRIHAVKLRAPR